MHFIAEHSSIVQCGSVQLNAVHYNAVQCSAVLCDSLYFSAVLRSGVVEGSGQKLEELIFQSLLQIAVAKVHCKLQSKVNIQHKNFPQRSVCCQHRSSAQYLEENSRLFMRPGVAYSQL